MNRIYRCILLICVCACTLMSHMASGAKIEKVYSTTNRHYTIEIFQGARFQLINWSGLLYLTSPQTPLKEALQKLKNGKKTYLYISEGYGGVVPLHEHFKQQISNLCRKPNGQRSCDIVTIVAKSCSSACISFSLVGDKRYAMPLAKFGFHRQYVFNRRLTIMSQPASVNYYAARGMDRDWLEYSKSFVFGGDGNSVEFVMSEPLILSKLVHRFIRDYDSVDSFLADFP